MKIGTNCTTILFDLDGTIIDSTKDLHYEALNEALREISPEFAITREEHETTYDALSTGQKLKLLTKNKGLDILHHDAISKRKQQITKKMMLEKEFMGIPRNIFLKLKSKYKLGLCTNTIADTTELLIRKLNLEGVFDIILTNETVQNKKPHPEMYRQAMSVLHSNPKTTVIFEDSEYGIKSAIDSGATVIKVQDYKHTINVLHTHFL